MSTINDMLSEAARAGFDMKVKALLQDPECDALSKDECGRTPLMHATRSGKEACVRLLLPVSDPLSKDADGWTALMHASTKGLEVCVRILLPVSDAWVKDHDGWTALMVAANCGSEACVRLLLPVSNVLARSKDELTARDWAKILGHEKVAQFIDAYLLAQNERAAIDVAMPSKVPPRRAVRRV